MIKEFLSDPFKKNLTILLVFLGIILLFINQLPTQTVGDDDLLFFFHPSCPHCQDEKPFLDKLEQKYDVTFSRYDVSTSKELYSEYAQKHNLDRESVPFTVIGESYILGFDTEQTTGVQIEAMLSAHLNNQTTQSISSTTSEVDELAELDLPFSVEGYSFLVLSIVLGLLDGFNPCAMWVLVCLISIISQLNDRRRIWIVVGSFIAASGILYFLFMTAWLNAFLLIGAVRGVQIVIAMLALGYGIYELNSFFKKEEAVCKVGDASQKKKTVDKMRKIVNAPLTFATIGGIIILAFVVNSIEFACSAAIPAVFTQTLTAAGLPTIQYYWYILVYTFFFMLDDLIIFGLAALAIQHVAQTKYMRYTKLIGGIILLALGILLAFFPTIL